MAEIKNPTARRFFNLATSHIEKLPKEGRASLPTLTRDSPELDDWMCYFDRHLRWRPGTLSLMLVGRLEAFTLPAQWPQWFDTEYAPPLHIPRFHPPQPEPREDRENYEELKRRHGPAWGIVGTAAKGGGQSGDARRPTDEELRRRYPQHQQEGV